MQTFMPYTQAQSNSLWPEFSHVARTLDNKRLNKQALEGWQILMNLLELDPQGNHRVPKGWSNHPAVKMWKGYEMALYIYIIDMVNEWVARGFKSTIADKATATITKGGLAFSTSTMLPPWINDEALTSSHRQALLVKDYGWYRQFNWPEDPGYPPTDYEYVWPINGGV